MDPTLRRAAVVGALLHLATGRLDLLAATVAFCLAWAVGSSLWPASTATPDGHDEDRADHPPREVRDRMARISGRARSETTSRRQPLHPGLSPEHGPRQDAIASVVRRAHAQESLDAPWAVSAPRTGSMMRDVAALVADGIPGQGTLEIVLRPDHEDLRSEFDALPPRERADEIERHLWAMGDASRVRTRFSPILSALGIR